MVLFVWVTSIFITQQKVRNVQSFYPLIVSAREFVGAQYIFGIIKEIIGKSDNEIKSFVTYVLDNLISYGAVHINKSTVAENSQLSRSKKDGSKPTNLLGKAAEIVTSKGRERKANREYNEFIRSTHLYHHIFKISI